MKTYCNVSIVSIVYLLCIQLLITGCAMTTSRDLYKKDLALDSQKLFQDKCSKCHELPVINSYPYAPGDWANVVDAMIDTKEARKFMTMDEEEKIKVYLGRQSQAR